MRRVIPHLFVANVERSIDFYTEQLGFTAAYVQRNEEEKPVFAILRHADVEVMVSTHREIKKAGKPASLTLYIEMEDVAGFWDYVQGHVTVVRPLEETRWGTREFWIQDPDGFVLAMFEEL